MASTDVAVYSRTLDKLLKLSNTLPHLKQQAQFLADPKNTPEERSDLIPIFLDNLHSNPLTYNHPLFKINANSLLNYKEAIVVLENLQTFSLEVAPETELPESTVPQTQESSPSADKKSASSAAKAMAAFRDQVKAIEKENLRGKVYPQKDIADHISKAAAAQNPKALSQAVTDAKEYLDGPAKDLADDIIAETSAGQVTPKAANLTPSLHGSDSQLYHKLVASGHDPASARQIEAQVIGHALFAPELNSDFLSQPAFNNPDINQAAQELARYTYWQPLGSDPQPHDTSASFRSAQQLLTQTFKVPAGQLQDLGRQQLYNLAFRHMASSLSPADQILLHNFVSQSPQNFSLLQQNFFQYLPQIEPQLSVAPKPVGIFQRFFAPSPQPPSVMSLLTSQPPSFPGGFSIFPRPTLTSPFQSFRSFFSPANFSSTLSNLGSSLKIGVRNFGSSLKLGVGNFLKGATSLFSKGMTGLLGGGGATATGGAAAGAGTVAAGGAVASAPAWVIPAAVIAVIVALVAVLYFSFGTHTSPKGQARTQLQTLPGGIGTPGIYSCDPSVASCPQPFCEGDLCAWPVQCGCVIEGPYAGTHSQNHLNAVDIMTGNGDGCPGYQGVYATFSGTVTAVYNGLSEGQPGGPGFYGNRVEIRVTTPEGQSFTLLYGHLIDIKVGVGATVKPGDQIGVADTTGMGSEHLHFEVRGLAGGDSVVSLLPPEASVISNNCNGYYDCGGGQKLCVQNQ